MRLSERVLGLLPDHGASLLSIFKIPSRGSLAERLRFAKQPELVVCRKLDCKRCSLTRLALDLDVPTMRQHELACNS